MRIKETLCAQCGSKVDVLDGKWARTERRRLGLSQREVARRTGVTPSMVCDVEKGRRQFSKATLAKFLKALK